MKRKRVILVISVLGIIMLGTILWIGYTNRVRYITEPVGIMLKDEQEIVTAKIFFRCIMGLRNCRKISDTS